MSAKSISIFILFLFTSQKSFSDFSIRESLKMLDLEYQSSTINSYERMCHAEQKSVKIEQFENICNILMSTSVCRDIPKEKKVNCKDPKQNEIDINSVKFITTCGSYLLRSIHNFFKFIKKAIFSIAGGFKKIVGLDSKEIKEVVAKKAIDPAKQKIETAKDDLNSISNYISVEYEKALEENKDEKDPKTQKAKAVKEVFGTVIKGVFSQVKQNVLNDFNSIGCYNTQARSEIMCKQISQAILMISAGGFVGFKSIQVAMKLIGKTPLKGLKKSLSNIKTKNKERKKQKDKKKKEKTNKKLEKNNPEKLNFEIDSFLHKDLGPILRSYSNNKTMQGHILDVIKKLSPKKSKEEISKILKQSIGKCTQK